MIFVDSGIYIARHSRRIEEKNKAEEILSRIKANQYGQAVTSIDILDEVISKLHKKIKNSTHEHKAKVLKLLDEEIEDSAHTELYTLDDRIRNNAKVLLKKYPGLATLTDFTTALFMKANKIERIASFDSEFDTIFTLQEFKDFSFKERISE